MLALDLLVPFAHWITPLGMPKRFDTHFYLAVAPADQLGAHDGQRIGRTRSGCNPNEAVEGAKTGKFKLVFATERNLIKLGQAEHGRRLARRCAQERRRHRVPGSRFAARRAVS